MPALLFPDDMPFIVPSTPLQPRTLTAKGVLDMAVNAECDGDYAESITLYQAAAQLYRDEGLPEKAKACEDMMKILTKKVGL